MAAFTPEDPHGRQRFDTHVPGDEVAREHESRDHLEGRLGRSIASFVVEGQTEVTYWVDRAVWGRGIASQALALFLIVVRTRPLKVRTASDNAGSLRVLEKAGSTIINIEVSFGIEETILRLG